MAVLIPEVVFLLLAIFIVKFRTISGSALVGITRTVPSGKFPSVVILKEKLDDKDVICSGALITYTYVFTAASCIANREEKRLSFIGFVIAGSLIRSGCSDNCQWRRVKDLTVHNGFFDSPDDPDNVGVIRVHKQFDASKTVHPMPPAVTKTHIGTSVYIVGFISIKDGKEEALSDTLQYGEATIMHLSLCEREDANPKYVCTNMRTGGLGAPVYQGPSLIGIVASVNSSDIEYGRLTSNAVFYRGFIDKFIHSGKYMKFRKHKKVIPKASGVAVMKSKMKIILITSVLMIMQGFRGTDNCYCI